MPLRARVPRRRRGMLGPVKKAPLAMVAVAILATALGLRLHGYTSDPAPGANYDGLGWAWQGQSLLLQHYPQAWSWQSSYHPTVFLAQPNHIFLPVVAPYFDHPPLFALVVGGLAVLAGQSTPGQITDSVIRLVPIVLSLVTLVLTSALVLRLTGRRWIALVVAAVLAVSPAMVLSARLVESEALLTPLLLAAILLALRVRDGGGRWWIAGLVAVCAAAALTKEPGIIVGVVAAAILLAAPGRRRLAWAGLAGAAGGVAIYLTYAAVIDWHVFIATVMSEAHRRSSVTLALSRFFTSTAEGLGNFVPLVDPVWYLGWPVLIGLAAWRREWRPVALAALAYALTICLLGDARAMRWIGWYRIPDEPLLYAAVITATCLALSAMWARAGPRLMGSPRPIQGGSPWPG
ncbi:MAG TPA: glycosyltransferase family 39 protein [Candidatus Dormibacteraeota bacterium]|nr:glycosyltransferase family 39 protein [Candidatus Dormibacteraeota bacterium]